MTDKFPAKQLCSIFGMTFGIKYYTGVDAWILDMAWTRCTKIYFERLFLFQFASASWVYKQIKNSIFATNVESTKRNKIEEKC